MSFRLFAPRPVGAAALIGTWLAAFAAGAHEVVSAGEPLFEPPAPGSYELPVIQRVDEHWLLASDGKRAPVLGIGREEVALVSFIYTSCPDACPLALAVLQRFDRQLVRHPEIKRRVKLVTVSFDPARDTPARMAEFRRHFAPDGRWRFLTAPSEAEIAPVLGDYGQDVRPPVGDEQEAGGRLSHVLKVFLVDGERQVRNIYSAGFLDVRILLHDAATVLGVY